MGLLELPDEMIEEITARLPLRFAWNLAQTCRHFYLLLKPRLPSPSKLKDKLMTWAQTAVPPQVGRVKWPHRRGIMADSYYQFVPLDHLLARVLHRYPTLGNYRVCSVTSVHRAYLFYALATGKGLFKYYYERSGYYEILIGNEYYAGLVPYLGDSGHVTGGWLVTEPHILRRMLPQLTVEIKHQVAIQDKYLQALRGLWGLTSTAARATVEWDIPFAEIEALVTAAGFTIPDIQKLRVQTLFT